MQAVGSTQMRGGTREGYLLLRDLEHRHSTGTAARAPRELDRQGEETFDGCLHFAPGAWRDGADADWIVGALVRETGDGLAPQSHDRLAAEDVIRPGVMTALPSAAAR